MRRLTSFRDFDWTLLTLVGLLSLISVIEIHSATMHTKFHGFGSKQVGFLAVGFILMFAISAIDYHKLVEISPWAYAVGIFALVAVKLVGTSINGGKRWINLGAGIHFQPSEWVKLILILAVARFFWNLAGRELTWLDVGKALALVCIPMYLVLKQPDLGTGLTYVPVLIAGLFLGGMRLKQALVLLLALAAIGGIQVVRGKHLKSYQQKRIDSFLDPSSDPRGAGYQILQSKIAVGSGGLWGK